LKERLEKELKHERKLNKSAKGIGIVSLSLLQAREIDCCSCRVAAVSGQIPRGREGVSIGGTVQFVATDCEEWHCLLQVHKMGSDMVGSCWVSGKAAAEQRGVWRPVIDGEKVVGHVELGYMTKLETATKI
jgi:hypothetical protein